MGIHPNVGITFDLRALRMLEGKSVVAFDAVLANLDNSKRLNPDFAKLNRRSADFRIYVGNQLRTEHLDFQRQDGNVPIQVPLTDEDRFLTILATDAGNTMWFDQLVLMDAIFRLEGSTGNLDGPEVTATNHYDPPPRPFGSTTA